MKYQIWTQYRVGGIWGPEITITEPMGNAREIEDCVRRLFYLRKSYPRKPFWLEMGEKGDSKLLQFWRSKGLNVPFNAGRPTEGGTTDEPL